MTDSLNFYEKMIFSFKNELTKLLFACIIGIRKIKESF